jgi:hypothetical protein
LELLQALLKLRAGLGKLVAGSLYLLALRREELFRALIPLPHVGGGAHELQLPLL